jgi:cytochrome c5
VSPGRGSGLLLAPLILALGACAVRPSENADDGTAVAALAGGGSTAVDAGVTLPDGQGREILVRACLACHDLGGLELFSGFYRRDDWRALVLTMQAHGADIDSTDVETLADYLALHFSPVARR